MVLHFPVTNHSDIEAISSPHPDDQQSRPCKGFLISLENHFHCASVSLTCNSCALEEEEIKTLVLNDHSAFFENGK